MLRGLIALLLTVAIVCQLCVLISGAFRNTSSTANVFSSWFGVNQLLTIAGERVDIWSWKTIDASLFAKPFDSQRMAIYHLFLSVCVTVGLTCLSLVPFMLKWRTPYSLLLFTAFIAYGTSLILTLTQVNSAFRFAFDKYGPSFYVWNVAGGALLLAIFLSLLMKKDELSKKYTNF